MYDVTHFTVTVAEYDAVMGLVLAAITLWRSRTRRAEQSIDQLRMIRSLREVSCVLRERLQLDGTYCGRSAFDLTQTHERDAEFLLVDELMAVPELDK